MRPDGGGARNAGGRGEGASAQAHEQSRRPRDRALRARGGWVGRKPCAQTLVSVPLLHGTGWRAAWWAPGSGLRLGGAARGSLTRVVGSAPRELGRLQGGAAALCSALRASCPRSCAGRAEVVLRPLLSPRDTLNVFLETSEFLEASALCRVSN